MADQDHRFTDPAFEPEEETRDDLREREQRGELEPGEATRTRPTGAAATFGLLGEFLPTGYTGHWAAPSSRRFDR